MSTAATTQNKKEADKFQDLIMDLRETRVSAFIKVDTPMIVGIKNARKEKMATKDEMLKFAMAIDSIVATQKSNYIDAIVEYCTPSKVSASTLSASTKALFTRVSIAELALAVV